MAPDWVIALSELATLVVSALISAVVAGRAWGRVETTIDQLKTTQASAATKDELTSVVRELAEIRGMFRLTLSPDHMPKL